MTVAKKPVANT